MRKWIVSVLFATLVGGSLMAIAKLPEPAQDWERFRVVKEGFSVLFPELPGVIDRGQYRSAPVRDARTYAAYRDGVVYFVISFDNPNHEKPRDYFFDAQLRALELRKAEMTAESEASIGNLRGVQHSFNTYDFGKTLSYPGVARLFEAKNRVLALVAIGKNETDPSVARFLQSLEINEKPDGKDIGSGATFSESKPLMDSPVMPTEVSRKVMILLRPVPQYTEDARHRRLRGGVVLKGVLSASGEVTNLKVVSGLPELAQSAIEVAHRIYFIPAVKNGRFVSTFIDLEYNFDIY
ncbi:MAG: energy transducer TonB [Acidobacteriota bacterium]